MSEFLKNYILKEIASLCKANASISEMMATCDRDSVLTLLEDCQKSAIKIGEFLEASDEKKMDIISKLEQYCEMLYQFSIMEESEIFEMKIYEKLGNILKKIKVEIEENLPTKYEILFLPYNAAMWDSLESIWIATKEDSSCKSYVMPIPYFDKAEDGSLGKMNYEGSDFPDYVQITSYQDYKIELRMPDVIYIHNPYDQYNKVTTIHSDYYAKKIKTYTNMLVYVPYFVSMDDVLEHFCVLPGTLYSDITIVQSEKIRDTYIREYVRQTKFYDLTKKFVALGSPKFDKVLNTKKSDIEIPYDWKHIIDNKKVILYNTSLDSLIKNKEKAIEKLKHVLECFKKHENLTLLWRPHPLNIATAGAMIPEVLREYQNIIEKYKKDSWGIYDDTADLHRAIAISDAYYGDWSSLVPIYGVTGKPIMIQNIDLNKTVSDDFRYRMCFEEMLIDNEYIWLVANNVNGLFRYDIQNKNMVFIGEFKLENKNGIRLYSNILKYKEYLIFPPLAAKQIAVYNIKTSEFKFYRFEVPLKIYSRYCENFKFFDGIVYKEYVFLTPAYFPAILRLNVESGQIDYYNDWVEQLENIATDDNDIYFRKNIIVHNNRIMIPSCIANVILEFNMDTCNSKILRVGDEKRRYSGICYDGTSFWLAPRADGTIIEWNKETNYCSEYSYQLSEDKEPISFGGCAIFAVKDIIWLFTSDPNLVFKINKKEKKLCVVEALQKFNGKKVIYKYEWANNYLFAHLYNNKIIAYSGEQTKMLVYDLTSEIISSYTIEMPIELVENRKEMAQMGSSLSDYIINENIFCKVNDYIDFVLKNKTEIDNEEQKNAFKGIIANNNGECGKTIHQFIMKHKNVPKEYRKTF